MSFQDLPERPADADRCRATKKAEGMDSEGPRAPRYQFITDAEVIEIASNTKLNAKTGDLSLGGCFVNMVNPSPEGTEIRVTISRSSTSFAALGRVVFVLPGMGMGVVFKSVEVHQLAVLQKWLSELSHGE